jgi:hypothetical protein
MLSETIKYTDFNGVEQTDTFHFHLSKAEIAELHLIYGEDNDYKAYLTKIVKANDGKAIVEHFKKIIRDSVGKKSEDGKRFIKSDAIADDFMQSAAYDEFFLKLFKEPDYMITFITGLFPKDIQEQIQVEEIKSLPGADVEEDTRPAWIRENRDPTKAELIGMTSAQMADAMRRRVMNDSK